MKPKYWDDTGNVEHCGGASSCLLHVHGPREMDEGVVQKN